MRIDWTSKPVSATLKSSTKFENRSYTLTWAIIGAEEALPIVTIVSRAQVAGADWWPPRSGIDS